MSYWLKKNLNNKKYLLLLLPFFILLHVFSDNFYLNFGYHNDFVIWSPIDNKCCLQFAESQHLINIGRPLQAWLQGFLISHIEWIEQFRYVRFLALVNQFFNLILVFYILQRIKVSFLDSIILATSCFLLLPSILNLSWITNYIPGILNLTFVLIAVIFFDLFLKKQSFKYLFLFIAFLFLILSFFNYPSTTIFFFIPIVPFFLSSMTKILNIKSTSDFFQFFKINTVPQYFLFYYSTAFIYFVIHKFVIMNILNISFNGGELYNFAVSYNFLGNFYFFYKNIFPNLINIFNPKISFFLIFIFLSTILIAQNKQNFKARILLLFLFVLAVSLINLLSSGGPPEFYRSWHGLIFILLLIFYFSFKEIFQEVITRYVFFVILLCLSFYAYVNNHYLVNILSDQLKSTKELFSLQYEWDIPDIVIIEKRNNLDKFNWGEFSFIHILNKDLIFKIVGEGTYPYEECAGCGKKNISTINTYVVDQSHKNIFMSKQNLSFINLIKKIEYSAQEDHHLRLPVFYTGTYIYARLDGVITTNSINNLFPITNISDGIYYTFWETEIKDIPIKINFDLSQPRNYGCYSITSGIDNEGNRMPGKWKLFGKTGNDYYLLDSQHIDNKWPDKTIKKFPIVYHQGIKFDEYVMSIDNAINSNILRLYNFQFYDECE